MFLFFMKWPYFWVCSCDCWLVSLLVISRDFLVLTVKYGAGWGGCISIDVFRLVMWGRWGWKGVGGTEVGRDRLLGDPQPSVKT